MDTPSIKAAPEDAYSVHARARANYALRYSMPAKQTTQQMQRTIVDCAHMCADSRPPAREHADAMAGLGGAAACCHYRHAGRPVSTPAGRLPSTGAHARHLRRSLLCHPDARRCLFERFPTQKEHQSWGHACACANRTDRLADQNKQSFRDALGVHRSRHGCSWHACLPSGHMGHGSCASGGLFKAQTGYPG